MSRFAALRIQKMSLRILLTPLRAAQLKQAKLNEAWLRLS
jgi:hypothetical protein